MLNYCVIFHDKFTTVQQAWDVHKIHLISFLGKEAFLTQNELPCAHKNKARLVGGQAQAGLPRAQYWGL